MLKHHLELNVTCAGITPGQMVRVKALGLEIPKRKTESCQFNLSHGNGTEQTQAAWSLDAWDKPWLCVQLPPFTPPPGKQTRQCRLTDRQQIVQYVEDGQDGLPVAGALW